MRTCRDAGGSIDERHNRVISEPKAHNGRVTLLSMSRCACSHSRQGNVCSSYMTSLSSTFEYVVCNVLLLPLLQAFSVSYTLQLLKELHRQVK